MNGVSPSMRPGFFKPPNMLLRDKDFYKADKYKPYVAREPSPPPTQPVRHSYYKPEEHEPKVDCMNKYQSEYPIGRTGLFNQTSVGNCDSYDVSTKLTTFTSCAKLDFSNSVVPPRTVTQNDTVALAEDIPVLDPSRNKVNKAATLLLFTQRHGREDNLMYRQTEQQRGLTQNEVKKARVQTAVRTSSYDFRRDFLGERVKSAARTPRLN